MVDMLVDISGNLIVLNQIVIKVELEVATTITLEENTEDANNGRKSEYRRKHIWRT